MQQGQKSSKKWVDYSDESEEQFDEDHTQPPLKSTQSTPVTSSQLNSPEVIVDHRSQEFIQQQLKRYHEARQQYREIWVLLESENQGVLDKKMRELKENPTKDVINVYMSRDLKSAWDVKVAQGALQSWIKDGIDPDRHIRVTVSDRNFKKRTENGDRPRGDRRGRGRGDRGDRGDRGERGERRGRGRDRGQDRGDREGRRRQRDPNQPKKVYVDKNTGSLPNNKVECEQKLIQQKQRHYTRQQAERVGAGLGNFRNKTKVDNPPAEVEALRKPKEEVKPWTRKQTRNQESRQQVREKRSEYREKQSNVEGFVAQKKKKYVQVDKPKQEKKQQRVQEKRGKDLLSEDSN